MSSIVLDSDGLIKVAKAGLLEALAGRFSCLIAEEVYHEVVVAGIRDGHAEAAEIEALLHSGAIKRPPIAPRGRLPSDWPSGVLGSGEEGTYRLFKGESNRVILTDDRAFLRYLGRRGDACLTPTAALVRLHELGVVTPASGLLALDRLKPLVRADAYLFAKSLLEKKT